MNNNYVRQIINVLDTKTNRISDATRVKNFKVTQDDIDRYGMEDIISTLSYLEVRLPRIVKVTWSHYAGKKRDVKSFSVNKAGVDDLFHIIGEKSSREQLDEMRKQVEMAAKQCPEEWLFKYYKERLDKLDRGTFLKDVDPEVDRALRTVIMNQEPVYERKFSEAFGDSKAFAKQYKERVCAIIRKYNPAFAGLSKSDVSDNMILRAYNILTYNDYFEFKGPLTYQIENVIFSSVGKTTGETWNTETMHQVSIVDVPGVKRVITIENKAVYYAQKYDPTVIYVYSRGFPSPITRQLLKDIINCATDAEIFHWSDLDLGGIRIFRFIEKNVCDRVQPLHMDVDTYDKLQKISTGRKLSDHALRTLQNTDAGQLENIKRKLLETGIGYEQEELL